MKTLYISDLDGTLLRSDERVSEYSADVINRFVRNGGCFSYATARSFVTASKVTAELNTGFPVICYNGAFILNSATKEVMLSNYFTPEEVEFISATLNKHYVYPVVFAYIDEKERFSYIGQHVTPCMQHFLDRRQDHRRNEVTGVDKLYMGDVFYIAGMDTETSLFPINEIFKSDPRFNCIYHKDIYSHAQWCELMPKKATKANAALKLKAMLGCDKLIVFGDGKNDISLFNIADESYAMANAVPELKEIATAVIDSNDNDGVAKWLEQNSL